MPLIICGFWFFPSCPPKNGAKKHWIFTKKQAHVAKVVSHLPKVLPLLTTKVSHAPKSHTKIQGQLNLREYLPIFFTFPHVFWYFNDGVLKCNFASRESRWENGEAMVESNKVRRSWKKFYPCEISTLAPVGEL